jgi:hypothetical protein
MSELERLIIRWSAMTAEFKEPCRRAWQVASPVKAPYDEQSEIAFLKELISIAMSYVNEDTLD